MKEKIINWIKNEATDEDILQVVSEVNSWDGSLQEYTFYYMEDLNDIFCDEKPTELLGKLDDDFSVQDEGFTDTIYGLHSCSIAEAVEDIKENIDEVAEAIENSLDNINADELKEYLEENE